MVHHTWWGQELRTPDTSKSDACEQVSILLSTQQSSASYEPPITSAHICESISVPCILKHFSIDFFHGWIWKMEVLNKMLNFWLWTNKKLNISEHRWILSVFCILNNSKNSGRWANQYEIINDFWKSPLQRCPNTATHAICVLHPFATTPSVLQKKE